MAMTLDGAIAMELFEGGTSEHSGVLDDRR